MFHKFVKKCIGLILTGSMLGAHPLIVRAQTQISIPRKQKSIDIDRWGKAHQTYSDSEGNLVYEEKTIGSYLFKGINIQKKIGYNDNYPIYRIFYKNGTNFVIYREIDMNEVPIKKSDCQSTCEGLKEIFDQEPARTHVGCYGIGARSGLYLIDFNENSEEAYFIVDFDDPTFQKKMVFGFSIHTGTWRRLGVLNAVNFGYAKLSPSGHFLALLLEAGKENPELETYLQVFDLKAGKAHTLPRVGEYKGYKLEGAIEVESFKWTNDDRLHYSQKITSTPPPDTRSLKETREKGSLPAPPKELKAGRRAVKIFYPNE